MVEEEETAEELAEEQAPPPVDPAANASPDADETDLQKNASVTQSEPKLDYAWTFPAPNQIQPKSRPLPEIISSFKGTYSFLQNSEIKLDCEYPVYLYLPALML